MSSFEQMVTPARDLVPVTPDDDDPLPGGTCRGVCFGTAGALAVVTAAGEARTIASGVLVAGIIHPLRLTRIKSSGTTATDIWVAY